MLTITDIRALMSRNRFDNKYEKVMMIVLGLFVVWLAIAVISQGFVTSDKTFSYSIPDSVVKMEGNTVSISYDFDKISINDYIVDRESDKDTRKGIMIFVVLGCGVPFVIFLVLAGIYSFKRERYVMIFQQKWLETGAIPDTDKL
jgi:hypothetical protein